MITWLIMHWSCQEARVRIGHRTTDWFQIGKGCILSPCLFNLYAEYIREIILGYLCGLNLTTDYIKSDTLSWLWLEIDNKRKVGELWYCWPWRGKKGAMCQGMQVFSKSWKRPETDFFPQSPQRGTQLADTFILTYGALHWISDLQNYMAIILCCVKPLNLW